LEAGRAIVQACTFNQSKIEVTVAANVVSSILTANQAEGGFRVRNHADKRTQMAFNEEDTIEWSAETRSHYQVTLGARGDARYLEGWQGPKKANGPFRWSGATSRLLLPVLRGKSYVLSRELSVPAQARSTVAGLHLDGKLVAPLTTHFPFSKTA
jgi:hypothetical protein